MKKLSIIVVVGLLQAACATSAPPPAEPAVLLSFEALASEISVTHGPLETDTTPNPPAVTSWAQMASTD